MQAHLHANRGFDVIILLDADCQVRLQLRQQGECLSTGSACVVSEPAAAGQDITAEGTQLVFMLGASNYMWQLRSSCRAAPAFVPCSV